MWQQELKEQVVDDLKKRRAHLAALVPGFDFLREQTGLFSVLPLSKEQVKVLREKDHVYMADSGRINIGGVPDKDIPRFAEAINKVL